MADASNAPKSPTLLPPRKSVELEDPGAHELETSENEDDHFSDAPEGEGSHSGPNSPIPITRVEKVDDQDNHGEVPGTAAYILRTQDAVPDEVEIIPDGRKSRRNSSTSHHDQLANSDVMPIPKTVVEKVDPASPSHGDVPGTTAHSKRKADAVPDVITQVPGDERGSRSESRGRGISPEMPIPKTVIMKVDSESSHGEVPGTDAFDMRQGDAKPDAVERKGDVSGLPTNSMSRSKFVKPPQQQSTIAGASPIAPDGGFGPMDYDESEEKSPASKKDEADESAKIDGDEGFGEDFDDFEAGAEDEDFGDFGEGFQQPQVTEVVSEQRQPPTPPIQSLAPSASPFPLLDFSEVDSLDDIIAATSPYLEEIFPSTKEDYASPQPLPSSQNSIFLTDRSLSLWSQLVAPPPLQPPNWVRSRIRRLFLVSLGVPVDLDEILPASKQKKLILPSMHLRRRSQSPPDGRQQGSRARLKQDNTSSASIDQPSSTKSRKRRGPPLPPQLDIQATRMLCATTEAALSNMTDSELQEHVRQLEEANAKASEVLEYWLKRRDSALGEKEAFEGVIENLVKHARRVRK